MAIKSTIRTRYVIDAEMKKGNIAVVTKEIQKSLDRMTSDMSTTIAGLTKNIGKLSTQMKGLSTAEDAMTLAQLNRYKKQVAVKKELLDLALENARKEQTSIRRTYKVRSEEKDKELTRDKEHIDNREKELRITSAIKAEDKKSIEAAKLNTIEARKLAQIEVDNNRERISTAKSLEAKRKKEIEDKKKILDLDQKSEALDAIKNIDPLKKTKILETELSVLKKQLVTENSIIEKDRDQLRVAKLKEQIARKEVSLNQARAAEESHTLMGILSHASQVAPVYMLVAQAVTGIQSAMAAAITDAIKFDNTMRVLSAVTGENSKVTEDLTHGVMKLGEAYGGTLADFAETTKELSRAGISTDELVKATEVTAQLGLITGDTIQSASNAIISYSQVYQKAGGKMVYTTEQLGDKLAYMANASRLSTEDIGTLSNYALASSKSVGITVDVVNGLAIAFSNAGNNASTIGTQIRRFTSTLSSSSEAVKNFYAITGTNRRALINDLMASKDGSIEGIQQSNEAFEGFIRNVQSLSDNEYRTAIEGMNILDNQFFNQLRNNGDEIIGHIKKSFGDLDGELEKTATISDGLGKRWERMWNTVVNATEPATNSILGGLTDTAESLSLVIGDVSRLGEKYLFTANMAERLALTNSTLGANMAAKGRYFSNEADNQKEIASANKLVFLGNKLLSLSQEHETLAEKGVKLTRQQVLERDTLIAKVHAQDDISRALRDNDLLKVEKIKLKLQETLGVLKSTATQEIQATAQKELKLELQERTLKMAEREKETSAAKKNLLNNEVTDIDAKISKTAKILNMSKAELKVAEGIVSLDGAEVNARTKISALKKSEVLAIGTFADSLKKVKDLRTVSAGIASIEMDIDRQKLAIMLQTATAKKTENDLQNDSLELTLQKANVSSEAIETLIKENNIQEAVAKIGFARNILLHERQRLEALVADEELKSKVLSGDKLAIAKELIDKYHIQIGKIDAQDASLVGVKAQTIKILAITNKLNAVRSNSKAIVKAQLSTLKRVTAELLKQHKVKLATASIYDKVAIISASREEANKAFGDELVKLGSKLSGTALQQQQEAAFVEYSKMQKHYDKLDLDAKKKLAAQKLQLEKSLERSLATVGKSGYELAKSRSAERLKDNLKRAQGDEKLIAEANKLYDIELKTAKAARATKEAKATKAANAAKAAKEAKAAKAALAASNKKHRQLVAAIKLKERELKLANDIANKNLTLKNINFQINNGYEDRLSVLKNELSLLKANSGMKRTEKDNLDYNISVKRKELEIIKEIQATNISNLNYESKKRIEEAKSGNNGVITSVARIEEELTLMRQKLGLAKSVNDRRNLELDIANKILEKNRSIVELEKSRVNFKYTLAEAQGITLPTQEQIEDSAKRTIDALNQKKRELDLPLLTNEEISNIKSKIQKEISPTFLDSLADAFNVDTNKSLSDNLKDLGSILGNIVGDATQSISTDFAKTGSFQQSFQNFSDSGALRNGLKNSGNPYAMTAGYTADIISGLLSGPVVDMTTTIIDSNTSVVDSIDILNNVQYKNLEHTKSMRDSLESMDNKFGDIAKSLFASSGFRINSSEGTTSTGMVPLLGFSTSAIQQAGLRFGEQTVRAFLDGVDVRQYENRKNHSSFALGLISFDNYSQNFSSVSDDSKKAFSDALQYGYNAIISGGVSLGLNKQYLKQVADAQHIAIGNIDLLGKKPEEIQAELGRVFGAVLSGVAEATIPQLKKFQQVGEDYLTTVTRVSSGYEQAVEALNRINVNAVDFTSIRNTTGDVGLETARESLIRQEGAFDELLSRTVGHIHTNFMDIKGIDIAYSHLNLDNLSGIGDIVENFNGSASDLIAMYTTLTDLQETIRLADNGFKDITQTMIDVSGSADTFSQQFSTYLKNYYTDQERSTIEISKMKLEFKQLNQVMPSSEAGFRSLVESVDTTTTAGQKLYAQLIGLSDGFYSMEESAKTAVNSTINSISEAWLGNLSYLTTKQKTQYSAGIYELSKTNSSIDSVASAKALAEAAKETTKSQREYRPIFDNYIKELRNKKKDATNKDLLDELKSLRQEVVELKEATYETARTA